MYFETERLILRRFTADDWQDLYEYLSDENVVRYEPYDVYTEEQCKKEAEERAGLDCFWAVCLKGSGKLIGNVFFQQQEPKEFMCWEIGYVFNPRYSGHGYATESCKALMGYAFQELNALRIVAMCNPENPASWRLLERLGLRREGHFIKNIFFKYNVRGEPVWTDTYAYAQLAEEWFASIKKEIHI